MVLEQYSTQPRSSLDPALRWFVPGLCYVYAKFPASVFQTVKPPGALSVNVTTLLVEPTLYVPNRVNFPLDNWQRTVQALSVGNAIRFVSDLNAARFKCADGKVWHVKPQEVLINDPYAPLRLVPVLYLMPVAEDHRLVITKVINGRTAVIEKKQHG